MKRTIILSLATSAIIIGSNLVSSTSFAQESVAPVVTPAPVETPTPSVTTETAEHPRIKQIEGRIENQEKRIDAGVESGKITAEQAAKDKERLAKTSEKLSTDAAEHNGHITKAEQKHLNNKLNKNSKRIAKQKKD